MMGNIVTGVVPNIRAIVCCFVVSVVALTLAFTESAFAGTTGVARGTVVNSKGLPIANARVVLTRYLTYDDAIFFRDAVARGSETTTSNTSGFFVLVSLAPGYYVVSAVAGGEYLYCHPRLQIDADMTTIVDLHMGEAKLLVRCTSPRLIKPTVSV